MDDLYLIAEVRDVHGVDGSVILKSYSDFPEHIFELEEMYIDFFGKKKLLQFDFIKKNNNSIIAKFRRFNSEADVLFLIGKKLYIEKNKLHNLPDDTFYIHDLIGSEVYIGSLFFGKLNDVLSLPSNDVYVITKVNGNEIMIPAVDEFVERFDVKSKTLFLESKCNELDNNEN